MGGPRRVRASGARAFRLAARVQESSEIVSFHFAPADGGPIIQAEPGQYLGLQLFIDKGCSSCHSGVNVGGHGYYPFGLIEKPGSEILPPGDKGRFAVTDTADDEYVFRASPLRNIALTAPYMHDGSVATLEQVLDAPRHPYTRALVAAVA